MSKRAGTTTILNGLTLVVLLLVMAETSWLHSLSWFDLRFGDLFLRYHAATQQPDPDVVIIDIDERSLAQMAPELGRYPWPRSVHAELIEGLTGQDVGAVAFDIMFSDPDLLQQEGDDYLVETAQIHPNVFFAFQRLLGAQDAHGLDLGQYGSSLGFSASESADPDAHVSLLLPMPGLAFTGQIGTINFNEDHDGVGRRYDLFVDAYGWHLSSLPAKVAHYLGYGVPGGQDLLLNWRGPALSYKRVSFSDIYLDLGRRTPRRPADEFKDKIVIVGSTASALHDLRTTPMSSLMPAVEIVATAIDNLKHGDYLRDVPGWVNLAVTFSLVLVLYLIMRLFSLQLVAGVVLLILSFGLMAGVYLSLGQRLVVPPATPLLFGWLYYGASVALSYWQERRSREHSVAMFQRFLDPRVVEELVDEGSLLPEGRGQSREVTVLFSDIRNFTTLSEAHTAEEVVSMLNDYFSRQVGVIFHHGGTMDKFIGDAIMAFWGAPVVDHNQAVNAVTAAMAMETALAEFRHEYGGEFSQLDIGIGIHSGQAVVGFIGSENRFDYTAIGDTVNLASRIEGQTKGLARILVSEATRVHCGDAFEFVDHGLFQVKGRSEQVRLYEPRGRSDE
ncbi:MAG: adenylate/guanylate cyclase domain-containing protein [Candidatus Sedimenticola sp. 6PFRAG1]